MTTPPRLLQFRVSHFNEKVRWALDYKAWPHTRRTMIPGFHLGPTRRLTGQTRLPVLEIDGRVLHDSTTIIAELERQRPDPPLYPADPAARARALAIETTFDEEVAPELRRLFWSTYIDDGAACARMATAGAGFMTRLAWRAVFPVARSRFRANMGIDPERLDQARQRLPGHLDRLEAEIGAGGYLVGGAFSIADLAAAAVMSAIVRPPQFSYPLPEPWPQALIDLRASVADRAGFRWVLDMYERHRGTSSEIQPRGR